MDGGMGVDPPLLYPPLSSHFLSSPPISSFILSSPPQMECV